MGEPKKIPDVDKRLVAVAARDLKIMTSFACEHERHDRPTCDEANVERGGCCNACWARRFAQKALDGQSMTTHEKDAPANLDFMDLITAFEDTVQQLGGQTHMDYERMTLYVKPPKAERRTTLMVFVLGEKDNLTERQT